VDPLAVSVGVTVDIEFASVYSLDSTQNYTIVNVTRTTGTFPALTWDATTCSCSNVLLQVPLCMLPPLDSSIILELIRRVCICQLA
jgi:hypothetical protein